METYQTLSSVSEDKTFSIEVILRNVDYSVVDYIAATKTHSTDAHLFLDLDMAIPSVNSAGSQLGQNSHPFPTLGTSKIKLIS